MENVIRFYLRDSRLFVKKYFFKFSRRTPNDNKFIGDRWADYQNRLTSKQEKQFGIACGILLVIVLFNQEMISTYLWKKEKQRLQQRAETRKYREILKEEEKQAALNSN